MNQMKMRSRRLLVLASAATVAVLLTWLLLAPNGGAAPTAASAAASPPAASGAEGADSSSSSSSNGEGSSSNPLLYQPDDARAEPLAETEVDDLAVRFAPAFGDADATTTSTSSEEEEEAGPLSTEAPMEPDPAMATDPPLRARMPPRMCVLNAAGAMNDMYLIAMGVARAAWRRQQCLAAVQFHLARELGPLVAPAAALSSGGGRAGALAILGVPAVTSWTGEDTDLADWTHWHALEQLAMQRARPAAYRCHRRPASANAPDGTWRYGSNTSTIAEVPSCDGAAPRRPQPALPALPVWAPDDVVLVLAPPVHRAVRDGVLPLHALLTSAARRPRVVVVATCAAELSLLGPSGTCSQLRAWPKAAGGGGAGAAAAGGGGAAGAVVVLPSDREADIARQLCPNLAVRSLPHPAFALDRPSASAVDPAVDVLFLVRDHATARSLRAASAVARAAGGDVDDDGDAAPAVDGLDAEAGSLLAAFARIRTAKLSFDVRFLESDPDVRAALQGAGARLPRVLPRARHQLLVDLVARGGVVVSDDMTVLILAAQLGRPFVVLPPRSRPASTPWSEATQYRGQGDNVRLDATEAFASALAWARVPRREWKPLCMVDGRDCLGRASLDNATADASWLRTLDNLVQHEVIPDRALHDLRCSVASLGGAVLPTSDEAPWAWSEAARAAVLLAKDRECGHRVVFQDRRTAFQVADHYRDAMSAPLG